MVHGFIHLIETACLLQYLCMVSTYPFIELALYDIFSSEQLNSDIGDELYLIG